MTDEAARSREVRDRLASVTDPELDESVVELGFISAIEVEGDVVRVGFRLPTYWCAANFAWMMADDMRAAVQMLPWVSRLELVLDEHMYADAINAGIASGRSFREAFGREADAQAETLDELRDVFRRKSFGRRQLAAIERLRAEGRDAVSILALRVADVASEGAYLERRRQLFGDSRDAPAFVDLDGRPIAPERFDLHVASLRSVATNMEFNGVLCRGLLAARYADRPQEEPELHRFMREAARAGAAAS